MRINMLLEQVAGHLGIDDATTGRIVGKPVRHGNAKCTTQNEDANHNPKVSATHIQATSRVVGLVYTEKRQWSVIAADWIASGTTNKYRTRLEHDGSGSDDCASQCLPA